MTATITPRPAPVSQEDRRRLFRAACTATNRMADAILAGQHKLAAAHERAARVLHERLRAAPAKEGET